MNNVFEQNEVENEYSGEMTLDEIRVVALKAFPHAQVETDNYGQWIVYTDIKEKK